jgi:hypothetical protein
MKSSACAVVGMLGASARRSTIADNLELIAVRCSLPES